MSKWFDCEYIETPLQKYYGGSDVVVYPWFLLMVIIGLVIALVVLK